jgi:membrane protein CcdC involved in cytochrome C biogenesis
LAANSLAVLVASVIALLVAVVVIVMAMGASVQDPLTVRAMAGVPPELAHAGL